VTVAEFDAAVLLALSVTLTQIENNPADVGV
jgi:hypothetical protein